MRINCSQHGVVRPKSHLAMERLRQLKNLAITAEQTVQEYRICEERSDEAIFFLYDNEIAAFHSQHRSTFPHSGLDPESRFFLKDDQIGVDSDFTM